MFELIPDHLRLFIVSGGLLLALLLVGSLSQKYEQYLAERRLAVQRILIGARQIEFALEKIRSGGLPPGLGRLLLKELLARYISVRQIYPRHPQINQQIARADDRLRSETEGAVSVNMAAITSAMVLNSYISGLNEIIGLLDGLALGDGITASDRVGYQLKVLDFQLTAASRFFTQTASEFAQKGEWQSAARNARALESFLNSKPKKTALASELRDQAKQLVRALADQRLPVEQPTPDPQS